MEDNKTKKTSKRVHPYAKKETLKNKKEWAKNKLKGSLVIDALPMKNPDFVAKDVKLPKFEVDYMKPEVKSSKQTSPLKELNQLVESVQNDPSTLEKTEILEEGEIVPGVEGTGTFHYSSLEELLDSVEVSYPCPIHQTMMEELKSKKEDCDDVFLRCSSARCPVFCNLSDYNRYYYECQRQGHPWFTLDRIDKMVCECGMTPTLSLTQSETNYGKMYLRCSRHNCDLFTWWRFKPNKRSVQILTDGCE